MSDICSCWQTCFCPVTQIYMIGKHNIVWWIFLFTRTLFIERIKKVPLIMYISQNIKLSKLDRKSKICHLLTRTLTMWARMLITAWNLMFIVKLVTKVWIKLTMIFKSTKSTDFSSPQKKHQFCTQKRHKTIVYWRIWFINSRINSSQK